MSKHRGSDAKEAHEDALDAPGDCDLRVGSLSSSEGNHFDSSVGKGRVHEPVSGPTSGRQVAGEEDRHSRRPEGQELAEAAWDTSELSERPGIFERTVVSQ